MAEVKSSCPALILSGFPVDVIIIKEAAIIRKNEIPPPIPIAQRRTKTSIDGISPMENSLFRYINDLRELGSDYQSRRNMSSAQKQ